MAHLVNNTERLPELLNTAEIPVVAVAVLSNRYIELDLRKISVQLERESAERDQLLTSSYLS